MSEEGKQESYMTTSAEGNKSKRILKERGDFHSGGGGGEGGKQTLSTSPYSGQTVRGRENGVKRESCWEVPVLGGEHS